MSEEKKKRSRLVRTVHVGLYGDVAEAMLKAIKARVKRFDSKLDSASMRMVEIERSPDNEIVMNVYDDEYGFPLRKTIFKTENPKSDADIRRWLAGIVKGIAKISLDPTLGYGHNIHKAEISKCKDWRRDCDIVVSFYRNEDANLQFSISQAYAVYEVLKGRTLSPTKFRQDVIDQTLGKPFDPVRTEIETFRIEELKRIDAELIADLAMSREQFSTDYSKLCDEKTQRDKTIQDRAKAKREQLEAEINASLAEAGIIKPAEAAQVSEAA